MRLSSFGIKNFFTLYDALKRFKDSFFWGFYFFTVGASVAGKPKMPVVTKR